ncbi:trehalose-phosphatase [Corynebacterium gerontici]|uniref:Trehalose 6-phosphate phosphatase n=1 Tax=Corynebacterium gerontici TaxID=2079234 RepID=A0A3G6IY36_9CORY|nr:trehalose-phosphatase [Corynebacterium gerontici]AZA10695.1 Trehalose-6-phosphate phosphatase [Corynebacterium gerontici]
MPSLNERLQQLARVPRLLIVSDFDGTLADFSTDPANVPVETASVEALETLAGLPDTSVAILSGRHLAGLEAASGFDGSTFTLVGSHGAECSANGPELNGDQKAALQAVEDAFEQIIDGLEGAFVEHKPFHRVLHVIKVEDQGRAQQALEAALAVDIPGVHTHTGKWIVEASVVDMNKGTWVRAQQEHLRPDSTLVMGDDTTDEHAFAVLGQQDLSIKVGEGDTKARYRVASVHELSQVLKQLAALRSS